MVDCGPNFGKEAQSLVGHTLRNLFDANRLSREEVIVTSKVGPLVQGKTLDAVKARAAKGRPFRNMTLLASDIGYCLDPEYIGFELTNTLKSLQLDCLDLLIIDAPELILPQNPSEAILGQLYHHLQTTMSYLEEEVKRGRIQYYGVSSSVWSALHRPGEARISLDMVKRTASTIPNSHFASITYPYNLAEPQMAHNDLPIKSESEPHVWSQTGRGNSVQMLAYEAGLIQFAIRSINTLIETHDIFTHIPQPEHSVEPIGQLYRLADVPQHDGAALAPLIKAAINGCVALEQSYALDYSKLPDYKKGLAPVPPMMKQDKDEPFVTMPDPREASWAQIILSNLSRLDLAAFNSAWELQIHPGVVQVVDRVRRARPEMDFWCTNYLKGMTTMAENYRKILETNRKQELIELSKALESACPALKENVSISSKAVRIASSSFATALVGMRTEDYVNDVVYGGGTPEAPANMNRLDPSLFGAIFDAGARHVHTIRENTRAQSALEDEMSVNARREAAEEQIMNQSLGPRQPRQ